MESFTTENGKEAFGGTRHSVKGVLCAEVCKCISGFERRGETCTGCRHGMSKATDVSDHLCTLCELGKFQHQSNSTACISCASATTTLQQFATSRRLGELHGNNHAVHYHEHELLVDQES